MSEASDLRAAIEDTIAFMKSRGLCPVRSRVGGRTRGIFDRLTAGLEIKPKPTPLYTPLGEGCGAGLCACGGCP